MKKTLGYGFKLSTESIEQSMFMYYNGGYLQTKKEVVKEIKKAKKDKDIPKNAKPKIFKVVVEVL
jgi:hypothetical protein